MNIWDPYVGEFFFGGRSIIVEGDTEYSAFQFVIDREPDKFKNIHIIRARGKFIIPSLMKILNHFGAPYAVLHDTDNPSLENGNKNPAWKANEEIIECAKSSLVPKLARVVASFPNFDEAFFSITSKKDKPYNAISQLNKDEAAYINVRSLLLSLLDENQPLPTKTIAWLDIKELDALVKQPS